MRIWQSLYLPPPHLFISVDLQYLHYILTLCATQSSAGLVMVSPGLSHMFVLSVALIIALLWFACFSIDLTEPQILRHYFV